MPPMLFLMLSLLTYSLNVQRLHKRFSSRNTQTNKSSKTLVLSKMADTPSLLPLTEAQLRFPGYQEFFFLFVRSANNYNFIFHLRTVMSAIMIDLSSNHTMNGLERRSMSLQVFARFLGFLIFSPNWHSSEIDSGKIKPAASADGLQQLESLGLSPMKIVEEAWKDGHVVLAVPWIAELFRMSKWDSLSQTSRKFRELLANLRSIQSLINGIDGINGSRFGPSMQVVSFYLEDFFHDSTGLAKLTSLPQASLTTVSLASTDSLDMVAVGFSSAAFYASSPHIEDFSNLVNSMCRSSTGKSPNKARKLRPSIVSQEVGLEATRLFPESPSDPRKASNISERAISSSYGWSSTSGKKSSTIQTKLADAFFHQHRDVREVCEFAVGKTLKNASSQILVDCIKPAFKDRGIGIDSPEEDFHDAQEVALAQSRGFLKRRLEETIGKSLNVLGPPGLHPKVLIIATSLAVTRGMHAGEALLQALVSEELKLLWQSVEKEKKKRDQGKPSSFDAEKPPPSKKEGLDEVISMIEALQSSLSSLCIEEVTYLTTRLQQVEQSMHDFLSTSGSTIPSESSLRRLFDIILLLDQASPAFIKWCMGLEVDDFCSILPSYLRLSILLSRFTRHGLKNLTSSFTNETVVSLVVNLTSSSTMSAEEISSLLSEMLEARILLPASVRACLDKSFDNNNLQEVLGLLKKNSLLSAQ